MRAFILLLFLIDFFQGNTQIKLGESINKYKIENRDSAIMLLVGSSQRERAYFIRIDSLLYTVTLSTNNLIHHISISDKQFKTKEGLKVGDTYSEIKKSNIRIGLSEERGWGKFLKLKSGWSACFNYKYSVDENSEILFFLNEKNFDCGDIFCSVSVQTS